MLEAAENYVVYTPLAKQLHERKMHVWELTNTVYTKLSHVSVVSPHHTFPTQHDRYGTASLAVNFAFLRDMGHELRIYSPAVQRCLPDRGGH